MSDDPGNGYTGPAELVLETETLRVEVTLRGFFEPIDGRFHWYGRVAHDADVSSAVQVGASAPLRTPHGLVEAVMSDIDPWGRFRVSGTGRPPFPLPEVPDK